MSTVKFDRTPYSLVKCWRIIFEHFAFTSYLLRRTTIERAQQPNDQAHPPPTRTNAKIAQAEGGRVQRLVAPLLGRCAGHFLPDSCDGLLPEPKAITYT